MTPEAATEHAYEPAFNATGTWTYPATNRLLLMVAAGGNHITQTNRRGAGSTKAPSRSRNSRWISSTARRTAQRLEDHPIRRFPARSSTSSSPLHT